MVRQVLQAILDDEPDIEVIGAASDPIFALEKLSRAWPDVIVLDVEMPRMDGSQADAFGENVWWWWCREKSSGCYSLVTKFAIYKYHPIPGERGKNERRQQRCQVRKIYPGAAGG